MKWLICYIVSDETLSFGLIIVEGNIYSITFKTLNKWDFFLEHDGQNVIYLSTPKKKCL